MLEVHPAVLAGSIGAVASKSETHRALFLAALSDGPGTIRNALDSADCAASLGAIQALGAVVDREPHRTRVLPALDPARDIEVDCANSGTTLRLASGIAATRSGATLLDGDSSLRTRPMAALLEALRAAGVTIVSRDGRAPLLLRGPLGSRELAIESPGSSQFVSGLVLALLADGAGGSLRVRGKLASAPYLDMTLRALGRHGMVVRRERLDAASELLVVPAGRPVAREVRVPGDWSAAAFALCGGALSGRVRVHGLPPPAAQADGALPRWLGAMGAVLRGPLAGDGSSAGGDWIEVEQGTLRAIDADLGSCPDLFPILAVTLAHARGRSRLHGAPQLRAKETDRIAVVARNLRQQGVEVLERPDGIELEGPARLRGGPIDSAGDHRILMAFAVGACRARAALSFADADPAAVAAVSYPHFFADLEALGGRVAR